MSVAFVLRMFGALRLEAGKESYTKFPTKRSALILARLAVSKDQSVGRDELAEQLWPDDFLDLTRLRLRQELRRLRQSIGELDKFIRTDRQWVELEPGCLTTDVQMFESALTASQNSEDIEQKVMCLRRAVDLLNGPFLAGFQEPWVLAIRRDYEEKARKAWLALADALQTLAEPEEALRATMNAVRHAPLDLDANASLIRRYVEAGKVAQARQAFYELDSMMFRQLGRHAPQSIRIAIDELPAAQPTSQYRSEAMPRSGVPRPAPLHGRAGLLESIQTSLARSGACVVLVGAVGVGKTHLLKEAAWQFSRANDLPVQFGGVPAQVSDGLYIPGQELRQDELPGAIRAAAETGWRVLAESRARLQSEGITEIVVNPLPTPSLSDEAAAIRANPAVQILLSKGNEQTSITPSDRDIKDLAEIARNMDGLPSALGAFSSRLMIQTPGQVLKTLDDGLTEFSHEQIQPGETVGSAVLLLAAGLSNHTRDLFISLSLLDGASVDLAEKLAAPMNPAEIWLSLEKQCLITVHDNGPRKRYRVPRPIAFAVRHMVDSADREDIEAKTWRAVGQWAYERSRQMAGPNQEYAFNAVQSELTNVFRALDWATASCKEIAPQLVCGIWRTVCARGNPSDHADSLYQAAKVGSSHPDHRLVAEAWVGAATALAISDRFDRAEEAYLEADKAYKAAGSINGQAWVAMNYAESVISRTDMRRAIEMAKASADMTTLKDNRAIALSYYAMGLADMGQVDEAIRVGEEVFASRLQTTDLTERARSYGELAQLYRKVGRPEAAEPLLKEGVRRLREAGIQDMLLEMLLTLAEMSADTSDVRELLAEANAIASRLGSNAKLLEVARARIVWASGTDAGSEFIAAVEDAFRFTQLSQSALERDRSLRVLATRLARLDKIEYANAVFAALGDSTEGPYNAGWQALLSSDSHATVCVLAVVMAKEAVGRRQ